MSALVRRVRPGEGTMLRDVRLRALLDTPSAFGSTHEREVAYEPAVWDERAREGSAGDARATFVAVDGEVCVGMVAAFPDVDHPGVVDLVGMWTAPEARRQGVAIRLVEAVLGWSTGIGAERLELWVTRGNEPAQRLYERLGFAATGAHQPLPSDPCKDELRMARSLAR